MPLSSGPTLFLAPAPIAWQAMHLLNEVLPAATSCASAADAAIDDAMTTSALNVSLFMVCSSRFRGWLWPCRMGRSRWTSSPKHFPVTSVLTSSGELAFPVCSALGDLPKALQTCLIRHYKSAGAARAVEALPGGTQVDILKSASD